MRQIVPLKYKIKDFRSKHIFKQIISCCSSKYRFWGKREKIGEVQYISCLGLKVDLTLLYTVKRPILKRSLMRQIAPLE